MKDMYTHQKQVSNNHHTYYNYNYLFIIYQSLFTTIMTNSSNHQQTITTTGGSTWTQTSLPAGNWLSIASDSTGQYLAAAGAEIFTSSSGINIIAMAITVTIITPLLLLSLLLLPSPPSSMQEAVAGHKHQPLMVPGSR